MFVYAVGSPNTVIVGLLPRYTHYRVVLVCRVAQIEIHVGFVVGKRVAPDQCIWNRIVIKLFVVREILVEPMQVFQPVGTGTFRLILVARKGVCWGKSVSVSVDPVGRGSIKQ